MQAWFHLLPLPLQTWARDWGLWRWAPHPPTGPSTLALLPHSATPPCPFLPLPSAKSYKSEAITVPRASGPLSNIAVSGEETVHPAQGSVPPRRRPPAGAQPLHPPSPSCAVARAGSLLPRVWRCDSGARSLGKSPDRKSSDCRLKFGGSWGQPWGCVRRKRLGSTVRLAASDSHLPLPGIFPKWSRVQGVGT